MERKTIRVSAPGKIILHGEHSVMYGKTALAVSLGLRSAVIIEVLPPTDDPKIHVKLPNVGLDETLALKPIIEHLFTAYNPGDSTWTEPTKVDHGNQIKKVEEVLHKVIPGFEGRQNFQKNSLRGLLYAFSGIFGCSGLKIKDFSIKMTTDLTVGAGTGSSASFAVCICGAMVKLVRLMTSGNVEEFSGEEKNIVSGWAFNCEKITHGAPSGIDNTTCTFGSLVSFKKGEETLLLPSPELRVLLVDSRIARETSKIVAAVKDLRNRNTTAVDHVLDAMDHVAITAARLLEKLSQTKSKEDIEIIYKHLHELWEMNHCLLASMRVSHPALEAIRSAAREHGFACKLTGAGGGGNAIVLIPPSTNESTVDALKTQLLNSNFRVTDTLVGGAGVEIDK